jgi:tripartite-type tricarboxylate transporter receptor subunit TctC
MLTRRHLIALSAAPALAPNFFLRAARAQKADFPNKPVRLIVPVAAGGPTDIVARMLGEKLSKMWGQQVVVENKGGAGTNIGNEYVAQSDPDGYTVLIAAPRPPSPTSYRAASTAISAAAHCCPTRAPARFAFWRPRERNGMRRPPMCRPSWRRACPVTT